MNRLPYNSFTRYATLLLVTAALAGCNHPFFKASKPSKPAKPAKAVAASDYTKHLALAQLSAEDASFEAINAYSKQKLKAPKRQPLLVLEYKNGSGLEQIAAPIALAPKNNEFPELLAILNQLESSGATLHNMYIVTTTVAPSKALMLPESDMSEALDAQEKSLLARGEKLPEIQEIEVQLRLIDFFIKNRLRDAAYLAVDNTKRQLSSMPQEKQLSQKLEALEGELRRTMPFSL